MAHGSHHIIPVRTLSIVFGALVALTFITVITSRLDLGPLNVPLALAIAGFKAIVVAAVFMALKYDNPVNMVVVSLGVTFAVIFMAITLSDTALRGALGILPSGHIPFEVETAAHSEPAEEAVPVAPSPPRTGQELYDTYCGTCHSLDGTVLPGPTFQGLGSLRTREEIMQSVLDPDTILVEGFPGLLMLSMLNALNFYTSTSDEELEALVTFIQAQ